MTMSVKIILGFVALVAFVAAEEEDPHIHVSTVWYDHSKVQKRKFQSHSQNDLKRDGVLWKYIAQHIQSTLVISNSEGLSETLRDIRTATYQS